MASHIPHLFLSRSLFSFQLLLLLTFQFIVIFLLFLALGLDFKCEVDRRCNQVLGALCSAMPCNAILLLLMLILLCPTISTATRCAQKYQFPEHLSSAEQCVYLFSFLPLFSSSHPSFLLVFSSPPLFFSPPFFSSSAASIESQMGYIPGVVERQLQQLLTLLVCGTALPVPLTVTATVIVCSLLPLPLPGSSSAMCLYMCLYLYLYLGVDKISHVSCLITVTLILHPEHHSVLSCCCCCVCIHRTVI